MRVLLIKRGAIGDLLMATPLIRQLKQKLDCTLDFLVSEGPSVALKNNPYLGHLHILPDKNFTLKGIFGLCKFLLLKRGNYDCIFILDKHWLFNLASLLVGSRLRVGYRREKVSNYLLNCSVNYTDVSRYHGLYYLDLLKASHLAIPNYADLGLDLYIPESDGQKVEAELQLNNLDNYIVVVNSGGNNGYETSGLRMLPKEKAVELLRLLLQTGQKILLAGGKNDFGNYQEYCKLLGNPNSIFNWAGKFNLAQSAYLIKNATRFYTTDCGAMHLGVAMQLGSRMKAIFGPTNPRHILPEEYLGSSAYWTDEEIYDPSYQLTGEITDPYKNFFMKLDPAKLLETD